MESFWRPWVRPADICSVLVLALYIATNNAEALYAHPHLLWVLCPLLLYWISHVWLTAHRGQITTTR